MSNGLVNIDSKLLEALQESTCFGLAYDDATPECKQCDVKAQCRNKIEGANIATPKGKPAEAKVSTPKPAIPKPAIEKSSDKTPTKSSETKSAPKPAVKKADKPTPVDNPNMPNFKAMTWEELTSLADKHGIVPKNYNSEAINRMRLIMELKKFY